MYWLRVLAVLLLVALLQVSLSMTMDIRGARPDLLLLVAVHVVVREPLRGRWRWNAFWVGWLAGLTVDLYSPGSDVRFGTTALVFGLLALGVSKLGEELFLDSALSQVLVLTPVCVAAHVILGLVLLVATGGPARPILSAAFWTGCYSGLVSPLVFAGMRHLERFLGVRSRRSFGRA
jgi:rod shape-determining protein MreD